MEDKLKKCKRKCGVSKKTIMTLLAVVLVIGCTIGGTVAWLTARSGEVVNTFTYGDININLWEHEYNATDNTLGEDKVQRVDNYKIIPGKDLPKDPTVTVLRGSEPCWLFVEVTETGDFVDGKVSYEVDTSNGKWIAGTGADGNGVPTNVYYREISDTKENTDYPILAKNDNQYEITVSDGLTKIDVNGIGVQPNLTFKAYAVQREGISTAVDAWNKVKPTTP